MKSKRRALALLCCLTLLFAAMPLVWGAEAGGVGLLIGASEIETGQVTLDLEQYRRNPETGRFQFQVPLELTTHMNRISYGAVLTFEARAYQATIFVECLTDLDGDGRYEWLDGGNAPLWRELTAEDTLSKPGGEAAWMAQGESRSIRALTLLGWGMETERSRVLAGESQLSDMSAIQSGDMIFCFTVKDVDSEGGRPAEWGTYYVKLEGGIEPILSIQAVGAAAFSDVPPWSWYWGAVDRCAKEGWLTGTGRDTFSPQLAVSRAALVQVLHNRERTPSAPATAFSDVSGKDWYAGAVAWGAAQGLVSGADDGRFYPVNAVTREQLAVILQRYVQSKTDRGVTYAALETCPDWDTVSPWARDALGWAVGAGLFSLRQTGQVDPAGSVTRGELAAVLVALEDLLAQ